MSDESNAGSHSEHESELPPSAGDTATPGLSSVADQAVVNELKAKIAYLSAEIDNMKKRAVREKSDIIRFANEELIKQMLPVIDNLNLAVKAAKDAEAKVEAIVKDHPLFSGLLKGVDMTLKHFEQTLEQVGVQTVKALGANFDPSFHEAVGQATTEDHPDNHVTGEMQKGFILNGRLLRPARVIVNKIGKA